MASAAPQPLDSRVPTPVLASPWGRWGAAASWVSSLGIAGAALVGVLPPSAVLGAGALTAGSIAAGVAWQRSGIFARPLLSVRTDRPELALTFDDGPDPRFTPAVLELLASRGQRATFFVIGERARANPQLMREIARAGHALGNHSFAHAYTTPFLPPARLADELRRTRALIEDASGTPARWFRPPVGLLSPRIAAAARLAEVELVGWTASARDGVASRTVPSALGKLEPSLRPGAILTLHDGALGGRTQSIAQPLLDQVVERMSSRGLRSVTLDALLSPSGPGASAPSAR